MKTISRILVWAMAGTALLSCQEIDIKTFDVSDSAACFGAASFQVSFKGVSDEYLDVEFPVTLIGPVTDYDREIAVRIADSQSNTAVEGTDFEILSHSVYADALKGSVCLRIYNFQEGVSNLRTTLEIVENENFKLGYPAYVKTIIEWSEEYVRPDEGVWRYWYLYFCHGYSKKLHELILLTLGEEVEKYTGAASYVTKDPTLTMKMPTWWYEASRTVYQAVREHDDANPGNPYRHSEDFQRYTSYKTAFGEGTDYEGDIPPTILETLETL